MRKLLKAGIASIIILVIIFLTLPLAMSFWIKNNYQHILNQLAMQGLSIKVVDFDRGWFESKATIQVSLSKSLWSKPQRDTIPTDNAPIQFTIQERIKNGPIVIGRVDNDLIKLRFAKALVTSASNDPNFIFTSTELLHFNNKVYGKSKIKTMKINLKETKVVLNNGSSTLTYTPKTHHIKTEGTFNKITFTTKKSAALEPHQQKQLTMLGSSFHSDLKKISSLWYGEYSIQLNHVIFSKAEKEVLQLKQAALHFKSSQANDTTSETIMVSVKNIVSEDLNLKSFDTQWSASHINTKSLSTLVNTASKLEQPPSKQQIQTLFPLVVDLISKGMTLAVDHFTIGTQDGAVNMTAKLDFPKQDSKSLPVVLSQANGALHLQMPTAWLKQQLTLVFHHKKPQGTETLTPDEAAQQQLQTWIDNKKLIPDETNVKLDITFKKGMLLVNGLPPSYKAPAPAPAPAPTPTTNHNESSNTGPRGAMWEIRDYFHGL